MLLPVIYRAAYMVFMFVAQLILANLLLPAGLGMLSLLILNASLVTLLTGIGSDAIAIHALTQGKWSIDYGFSFLLKSALLQLALFGLMQWVSLRCTNVSLLSREKEGWMIEPLYFVGLIVTEKMLILYYATQRARQYNILLAAGGVTYLGILSVIYLGRMEVKNPLLLVALQSLLQGILLAVIFFGRQNIGRIININWKDTIGILRISITVMITNLVQLIAYRVDFWLLHRYYSDYEVGIYAQANKFAGLLWALPNIIAMMLIARFSKMQSGELPVVFRIANVLNMLMATLTAVFAFVLYHYILLPQYSAGFKAFWIMLPGYFCWALVIYFGAYFSWKGAFKINLLASSFCLLIIFIADIILIPLYAVDGAALANSIAYTGTLGLYLFIAGKSNVSSVGSVFHFRQSDVRLFKKLLR